MQMGVELKSLVHGRKLKIVSFGYIFVFLWVN